MKRRGVIGILLLGLILIAANACASSDEGVPTPQPPEATKNDVNVTVIGDGNIEASSHESLTFGSGGKVGKIYVKEGDRVNKADVLAKLDTGALELAEAQAQAALTQTQVALTRATLGQQTSEQNLRNTRDMEDTLELALSNAHIEVRTARFNLEKTSDLFTWSDVKTAKADVDAAQD